MLHFWTGSKKHYELRNSGLIMFFELFLLIQFFLAMLGGAMEGAFGGSDEKDD
jgi:hypothetical protein